MWQHLTITLAALAIATSTLAMGGVHADLARVVSVFALSSLAGLLWMRRHEQSNRMVVSIPALAFALFCVVAALQTWSLPAWLTAYLSPTRAGLVEAGQRALLQGSSAPADAPLSLWPASSSAWIARWAALFAVATVAANLGRTEQRWLKALWAVVCLGAAVLLLGVVQTLAFSSTVFLGVWSPRHAFETVSTFLSPNHAATFYGFAGLAAFGIAAEVYRSDPRQTLGASAAGVVFVFAMLEHGAEGPPLVMGLVGLVVLIAIFSQLGSIRRRAPWLSSNLWWIAPALVFGLPLSLLIALELAPPEFRPWLLARAPGWIGETGVTRIELARAAIAASRDFAWSGAGAGATPYALSSYVDWTTVKPAFIPTIEAEPVEWLFTMGWGPGAISILLLSAYLWSPLRLYRRRQRMRYIVLFAIAAYFLMLSLLHFVFLAMGIAMPVIALMEFGRQRRDNSSGTPPRTRHALTRGFFLVSGRTALFAWVGLAGLIAASLLGGSPDDRPSPPDEAALAHAITRTPGDALLYARAAEAFDEEDRPLRAAKAAQRAWELQPIPSYALLRARMWSRSGDLDACIRAYADLLNPTWPVMQREWRRWMLVDLPTAELRARALAGVPARHWEPFLQTVTRFEGRFAAVDFAASLVEAQPESFDAQALLIRAALNADLLDLADLWARRASFTQRRSEQPTSPAEASILMAEVAAARGDASRARDLLDEALTRRPQSAALGFAWLKRLPDSPDELDDEGLEQTRQVIRALCNNTANEPDRRATCLRGRALLLEAQGELSEARATHRRLFEWSEDALPLAKFLERQGDCVAIEALLNQMRARKAHFERKREVRGIAQRCAR